MATSSSFSMDGWYGRAGKIWYPTNGTLQSIGSNGSINHVVSSPTLNNSTSTSGNKYTTALAFTTPSNSAISSITSITISWYQARISTSSGTVYGTITSKSPFDWSTNSDTVTTYRNNAVYGSKEGTVNSTSSGYVQVSMTITGTFSTNTRYYLILYTKNTDHQYQINPSTSSRPISAKVEYTVKTYKITYDANGGTGAPNAQTKTHDVSLTLSSTKPAKASTTNEVTDSFDITGDSKGGYFGSTTITTTTITATTSRTDTTTFTFSKWNTKKDGSGTNYNAGAKYTANEKATLYAQYTESTTSGTTSYENNAISGLAKPTKDKTTEAIYTITFEANGGSCSTSSLSSKKTRTYTFKGWAESETATSVLDDTKTYTAAKTVYAVWGETDSTESITLPTPTRTGYEFVGWATTENATIPDIGTGDYFPVATDTFYAVWKANGSIRIYVNSTDKYKMAMVWVYAPSGSNDEKPWKLAIPYLKTLSDWKITAG